jgi:nucleotide-binding universal stress UspA family protein
MFSKIVVGTDGSETADAAVDIAIDLARRFGATLHIVNAFRAGVGSGQVALAGAPPGDQALEHAVGAEASEQMLADVAARATGLTVETHSVSSSPGDAVVEVAADIGADLIVVGNKGMHRRVFGSVPSSIGQKAPCSLLIAKTT